jgi:hypothetical protein
MEVWIRDYFAYKYPGKQLTNEALDRIIAISNSLISSLQNVNISDWILSNLDKYQQKDVMDKLIWAGKGKEIEEIIKYIISAILEISVYETKNNIIDEYDIFYPIYTYLEWWNILKNHIPLFAVNIRKTYEIPGDILETIGSNVTDGFIDGFSDVLNSLNKFYKDTVNEQDLETFKNTIANFIIQRARQLNPNGTLTFRNLMYAVYNNPQIANVPWIDVFTQYINGQ